MSKKNNEGRTEGYDLPFFYAPDLLEANELPEAEARHANRVLRMGERDEMHLTDGKGALYLAEISGINGKEVEVACIERLPSDLYEDQLPELTIAIAPTKNIDRIEWMCEKLTELGVTHIALICTDHCERKKVNMERMEKVLVAAMKQSKKSHLPQLTFHHSLQEFLATLPAPYGGRYIACCDDEGAVRQDVTSVFKEGIPSIFLIGPEGDFSPEEVRMAKSVGAFTPIALGKNRLRTETAGLYVGTLHRTINLWCKAQHEAGLEGNSAPLT